MTYSYIRKQSTAQLLTIM